MLRAIARLALSRQMAKIKKRYDRYLSLGDYISDRWKKAELMGLGRGTSIYDNVLVIGNVKVGRDCWIGPNCILDGSGGELVIGDRCAISAGVHIYTHNSRNRYISEGKEGVIHKSVTIGDNCFIGPNSVIALGSTIGNKCTIGALSFVNGLTLKDGETCFGIPAKIRR